MSSTDADRLPALPPGGSAARPVTRQQAAALASAVRLRILRLTCHGPLTNKEIAQRLGRDPATTLHHVRKLVDAGYLEALPTRRGTRGAREKPYRAIGLSWSSDLAAGDAGATVSQAMFEAFLGEVAEIGVVELDQARFALQVTSDHLELLRGRLAALLAEFTGLPVMPGQPYYGVYVAVYPIPPQRGEV